MYTTVYTLAFDGHVGRSRVLNPAPLYFFETYHQSNWCCSECRVMKTLFLSHEKHEKTVKICWCSECRGMKTLLLSHEKTVWNEVRTNNIGRDDATHEVRTAQKLEDPIPKTYVYTAVYMLAGDGEVFETYQKRTTLISEWGRVARYHSRVGHRRCWTAAASLF